jgi:hypothetical protein
MMKEVMREEAGAEMTARTAAGEEMVVKATVVAAEVRLVTAEAVGAVGEVSVVPEMAGMAAQEEMEVAKAPEGYIPGMEAVEVVEPMAAEAEMAVAAE